VHRLLQECRTLRVLATSREALGTAGELVWRVAPLSFPPADSEAELENVSGYAAVRLFIDRAQLVQPGFVLAGGNAAAVAEICRRLDGIPLAIELAAARVRVLAPEQIARRLDDRFALLLTSGRTTAPRHQTLRAAVEWSYDLLSAAEQRVLARATVFAGAWPLEAGEVVLAGRDVDASSVLDLLTQLVDKSLLAVDSAMPTAARYRLLETLRQFALEKLERFGDVEALRRRHASFYVALAERVVPDLGGSVQQASLDRLEQERDNFHAALSWTAEVGDAELTQRLAGALRHSGSGVAI
jgi:predicted ATPase